MKINKIDKLKEIIEIENDSNKTVDISGWKLLDSEKFKHPNPKYRHAFIFPKGTIVKPGKVLRVHTFSGTNTFSDIYQNRKAPIWNNTNDVAILLDENENPASVFPQQPLRTISGYVYKSGTEKGIDGAKVVANLSSNHKNDFWTYDAFAATASAAAAIAAATGVGIPGAVLLLIAAGLAIANAAKAQEKATNQEKIMEDP